MSNAAVHVDTISPSGLQASQVKLYLKRRSHVKRCRTKEYARTQARVATGTLQLEA